MGKPQKLSSLMEQPFKEVSSTNSDSAWEKVQREVADIKSGKKRLAEVYQTKPFVPPKSPEKALTQVFEVSAAEKYTELMFTDFETDRHENYPKLLNLGKAFVHKWANMVKMQSMGFYFYSPNGGSGKTMLSAIIANEVHKAYGCGSQLMSMMEVFRMIQESYRNSDVSELRIFNMLKSIPLMIIDEIGFEDKTTEWRHDKVFEVIDARYNANKPTIFTSNLRIEDLPYHPRVRSRINEMSLFAEFPNIDFRSNNNQAKRQQFLSALR